MISTPIALFGYVAFIVNVSPTDEWKDIQLAGNGLVSSGIYYYTHGLAKCNIKETSEQLADRTPGWLNTEHYDQRASSPGTLKITFPVETEWVCIPHIYNKTGLPEVTSINLTPGQNVTLNNGDDIFLVRGDLIINDRLFTGPSRIRVRKGACEATCGETNSYSIKVMKTDF